MSIKQYLPRTTYKLNICVYQLKDKFGNNSKFPRILNVEHITSHQNVPKYNV